MISVALKTQLETKLGKCMYNTSLLHRPDYYIGFTPSCRPPHFTKKLRPCANKIAPMCKQSNASLYGALNEINCSSDVRSCYSFRFKFFARSVSCFKPFSLIEYAFANFFKCSSDRNVSPPGQIAEIPERIAPEP